VDGYPTTATAGISPHTGNHCTKEKTTYKYLLGGVGHAHTQLRLHALAFLYTEGEGGPALWLSLVLSSPCCPCCLHCSRSACRACLTVHHRAAFFVGGSVIISRQDHVSTWVADTRASQFHTQLTFTWNRPRHLLVLRPISPRDALFQWPAGPAFGAAPHLAAPPPATRYG